MRKPTMLLGSLGAFIMAAILTVGFQALLTPAAHAGGCLCPPDTYPVTEWGMGSSCAAAKANCLTRAQSAADGVCQSTTGGDSCGIGSVFYNSCYASYKVDCVVQVQCEECELFPPL
ncbi:MAG: hypothetical protein AAGM22_18425 [Acidobacteriota bacterium]